MKKKVAWNYIVPVVPAGKECNRARYHRNKRIESHVLFHEQ